MRIGVDIRVLMDKYYSGISEYTANLLTALLRQDQKNHYRLFYNSWHDQAERLSAWEKKNATLVATRWPNKVFNYLLQKSLAWPKIDNLLGGVDIFWSPHFNFSRLNPLPYGPKKIITVHDLSFLRYPEFFSRRKNFWHRALGVKKIMREAEAIVAVSENTKNDIMELAGVSEDKIKVIYSGNNLPAREVSFQEKQTVLEKFNIRGSFILYIGNIEPRKNIAGLISAFDILKNSLGEKGNGLELILAGADGWKNRHIYRTWQNSPYKGEIKFLGYIEKSEKEVLYSTATAFAYPSFYEGFGFPPLEALAYGLPLVCSNVSSLPEVVGEAAILINPYRPLEIAKALELILSDQDLRLDLAVRGQKRAKRFSWDKSATQYLELFENL